MLFIIYFLMSFNLFNSSISFNIKNDPKTLDPIFIDPTSMPITASIYEGLVKISSTGQITEGLAETFNTEGKSIIFKLRKDAKWSDGSEIEAKDFLFAFKRLLDQDSLSPYAYLYFSIENAKEFNEGKLSFKEVGIKVLDKKTLKITFNVLVEEPLKIFGPILAFTPASPIKKSIYLKNTNAFGNNIKNILASGPYEIKKWELNNKVNLVVNNYYYEKIQIKELDAYIVREDKTAINMFKIGDLDLLPLISSYYLKEIDKENLFPYDRDAKVIYLEFNTTGKLIDPNLREAINYAIDREKLCKNILEDNSTPARALIPVNYLGKDKSFREDYGEEIFKENLSKAKKLLDKVNLEFRKNPLKLLCINTELHTKLSQYIQSELEEKLGLKIEIHQMPSSIKIAKVRNGEYDISLSGWMVDYLAPPFDFLTLYTTTSNNNTTNWHNEEFDKIIQKALNAYYTKDKFDLLAIAEKILFEPSKNSFPIAPLYFGKSYYAKKTWIKNVNIYAGASSPNFRQTFLENK